MRVVEVGTPCWAPGGPLPIAQALRQNPPHRSQFLLDTSSGAYLGCLCV